MNYRDNQIEQYIRGRMSGKSLEEFERKLTVDSELRRSVQVERAITETVRRDAAFAPAGTGTPTIPAALAAKVAATPAAVGLNVVAGGGVVGTIFGTKIGITVVSVVGAIGIALGVLLIAPLFDKVEVKNPSGVAIENVQEPDQGRGMPHVDSANRTDGRDAATSPPPFIPPTNPSASDETSLAREQETTDSRTKVDAQQIQAAPSDTDGRSASQKMLDQLRREEKEREMPTVKSGSAEIEMEVE